MDFVTELSPNELDQVRDLCQEYEIAWYQSPQRIKLQVWVEKASEKLRPRLFAELLTLDGQLRAMQSESLSRLSLSEICPFDVADSVAMDNETIDIDVLNEIHAQAAASGVDKARESLLNCPTLAGISADAARDFNAGLQSVSFEAGETLLKQGQPAGGLFVIVRGKLEVTKKVRSSDVKFAQCGAGSVVGEMSLLTGKRCTATVAALTPIVALRLGVEEYKELTQRYPEIEIALSQLISDRLGSREVDALCGRTIRGYRLSRCISRGGMAVVYECRNETLPGQKLALKMLRHQFIHESHAVEHFERESDVLRSLNHPHIVSVIDAFIDYRTRFLVMPMYDGQDIAKLLRRYGRLDEACVRALLGQITAGLLHAHQNNIIHMDLKPANVLMNLDGTAAIADFGLCNVVGADILSETVMGTPAYMPPEQLRGDKVCSNGDWYALACMAYELLSGEKLFDRKDWMSLLLQKERFDPEHLPEEVAISDELRATLQGALTYEPGDRTWPHEKVMSWAKPIPEWMVG
ncbi:protein kinase domain-containing protein [Aporhodopirellula aestuarii]|uniref:non-specific serine/threonine protein kinase n=1 Tax=Aporhodopirellula aestuarii TaxID=2950107 RepID=A0ABT0UEM9_9BACT|nr:protein kinase [Aporhodopirellula aestuarii]MCM2375197.1 protein kinase [Aporhodopirellula aestuarii]